jgi:hypothetical protein
MTVQFLCRNWLDRENGEGSGTSLALILVFVEWNMVTAYVVVRLGAKSDAEMAKKECRKFNLMAEMCEET